MRFGNGRRISDSAAMKGARTEGLNRSTEDERRATLHQRADFQDRNGNREMAASLRRAAGMIRGR